MAFCCCISPTATWRWKLLPRRTPKAAGAVALMQDYAPRDRASVFAASVTQAMLITKSAAAASTFAHDPRWRPARDKGVRAWSDDYTNVFGALVEHAMGR